MSFLETLVKASTSNTMGFAEYYTLLYSIVYGLEARKCFEFGTGFSSRVILEAMKEQHGLVLYSLISCDTRDLPNFKEPPTGDIRWTFINKDSREVLKDLLKEDCFDFALHDGSHNGEVVEQDLKLLIPHLKQDSIILVHDVMHERFGKGIRNAIKNAFAKYKIQHTILPYGGGLSIIRFLSETAHGKVEQKWVKKK